MVKNLNIEQRRFLRYLLDNHKGLGRSMTINSILKNDEYHTDAAFTILRTWKELTLEHSNTEYFTTKYGKPTKYLKG